MVGLVMVGGAGDDGDGCEGGKERGGRRER